MINKWISNLKSKLLPGKIAGVEVLFSREGLSVNGVLLRLDKGNISLVDSFPNLNSLEELLSKIPKGYPISLIVNGKGVLHKTIIEEVDIHPAINQLFPNIKKEDFYFQQTPLEKGSVVSIVKRNLLNELKQKINASKLQLLSFSIGAFHLANLFLIDENLLQIQGAGQKIGLNASGQISSYESVSEIDEEKEYNIENLKINQSTLLAFSAGVSHLLALPSKIIFEEIEEEQKEYLYSRLLAQGIPIVLGCLLLVLAINTFFYYQLKDSTQLGQLATVEAQQRLQEVKNKRKALKQQSNLFNETGANSLSSTSFYADRIGKSLPNSIQLSELEIFPPREKKVYRRSKELIQYDPTLVAIRGICESSQGYNEWLSALESEEWVRAVRHENFRDLDAKVSEFLLTIVLEGETGKL